MATSGTYAFAPAILGYNSDMSQLRFAPRHAVPAFSCEIIQYSPPKKYRDDSVITYLREISNENKSIHNVTGSDCAVYAAVNTINNGLYIGATDRGVDSRSKCHIYNARCGVRGRFYNSIRKHGEDAFEFLILTKCKDFFDALSIEEKWIGRLRPEYNMTDGGGGTKGYKFDRSVVEKNAAMRRGKPSPKKGRKESEEYKQTAAAAAQKMWDERRNNPKRFSELAELSRKNLVKAQAARKRAVVCVSDGNKIFDTVTSAADYYDLCIGQVSYSCMHPNHRPRKIPKFRYANND